MAPTDSNGDLRWGQISRPIIKRLLNRVSQVRFLPERRYGRMRPWVRPLACNRRSERPSPLILVQEISLEPWRQFAAS